jgi:hypothetical protein
MIVDLARAFPELSSRELALRIVDTEGWYVSESTVFRALKREGLIKAAEVVGFKAGKEYHRKTKGGWQDLSMALNYTRSITFDDCLEHYREIESRQVGYPWLQ